MIFREFLSISFANGVSRFSGLIITPFLMIVMSNENLGLYDTLWVTLLFLELLFGLKISDGLFRYASTSSPEKQKIFLSSALKICTVSVFILTIVLSFYFLLFINELWITIFLMFFIVSIRLYLYIIQEYHRAILNLAAYTLIGLMIGFGYLINVIIQYVIFENLNIQQIFMGVLAVNFVTLTFAFKNIPKNSFVKTNIKDIKKLMKFGLSLLPSALAWWSMRLSSRWIVFSVLGASAVAFVTKVSYPITLLGALVNYSNMALQRKLFKNIETNTKQSENKQIYEIYRFFIMMSSIFVVLACYFIIETYFMEFIDGKKVIALLGLSTVFMGLASFYGTFYSAKFMILKASVTSLFAAIICLFLTYFFVVLIGVEGFSYATLVSAILFWIIRAADKKLSIGVSTFFSDVRFFIVIIICFFSIIYLENFLISLFIGFSYALVSHELKNYFLSVVKN